ncbi:MAG: MarR family winged helix-turn-helix transcriptional regulator [Roseobacter sp.]
MTHDDPNALQPGFLSFLLFQVAKLNSRNFQCHSQLSYGIFCTERCGMFHLGSAGDQTVKQICNRVSLHKTKVTRAMKAFEKMGF